MHINKFGTNNDASNPSSSPSLPSPHLPLPSPGWLPCSFHPDLPFKKSGYRRTDRRTNEGTKPHRDAWTHLKTRCSLERTFQGLQNKTNRDFLSFFVLMLWTFQGTQLYGGCWIWRRSKNFCDFIFQLFLCLSVCLLVYMSVYLSVCQSSICLSVCLSLNLWICLSVSLSV